MLGQIIVIDCLVDEYEIDAFHSGVGVLVSETRGEAVPVDAGAHQRTLTRTAGTQLHDVGTGFHHVDAHIVQIEVAATGRVAVVFHLQDVAVVVAVFLLVDKGEIYLEPLVGIILTTARYFLAEEGGGMELARGIAVDGGVHLRGAAAGGDGAHAHDGEEQAGVLVVGLRCVRICRDGALDPRRDKKLGTAAKVLLEGQARHDAGTVRGVDVDMEGAAAFGGFVLRGFSRAMVPIVVEIDISARNGIVAPFGKLVPV